MIEKLEKDIKALQNRLSLDSRNSHKPPSFDGFKKKVIKGLRKLMGRNSGEQPDYRGETLKMVDNHRRIIRHGVERCKGCQRDIQDAKPIDIKKRQVFRYTSRGYRSN
ncbi:MAG: DUF6444 domain-containing protein [bacterium]